jgi:hypothetical protein
MSIIDLSREQFPIFVDTSVTVGTYVWKRIGFATEQSIAMNPQTESVDYAMYANAVEEVRSNQIEIPTNIALKQGDGAFEFFYDKFKARPTGTACNLNVLVCFPEESNYTGWLCADSTVVFGSLAPFDKALDFSLKLGGVIDDGTVVIANGVPTFTT